MCGKKLLRRDLLKASVALAAGTVFPEVLRAAAPMPTPLSPALIEAARREGTVAFYTAMEIPVAESLAKAFEAKYPGIAVRVKRSGAERVFQRIGEEEGVSLYEVDVVCSTDAAHFIHWKRDGLLASFVPEDVAKLLPTDCGRNVCKRVRAAEPHRLQHQSGGPPGCAKKLRRPARSKMEG